MVVDWGVGGSGSVKEEGGVGGGLGAAKDVVADWEVVEA